MELWMLGIILLIAGFALIGVEMVVPGFGVPGISGIISLIVGICLTSDTIEEGLTVTMVVVVILAVMLTVFMLTMKKVKTPIVLEEHMKAEVGFLNASDLEAAWAETAGSIAVSMAAAAAVAVIILLTIKKIAETPQAQS